MFRQTNLQVLKRFVFYSWIALACAQSMSCAGKANVKHASISLLESARIVAVMKIGVANTSGGNMIGAVIRQAANELLGENTEGENFEDRFSEYLISSVNRSLLDRGYAPIQRIKIRQVEQEQAYQQSGLTKNAVRIGELLDAGSVFTGQLSIRQEEGIDYPLALACLFPIILVLPRSEAEVVFSGELTHVKTGALLASGVSSGTMDRVNTEEINEIIEAWFDELPEF